MRIGSYQPTIEQLSSTGEQRQSAAATPITPAALMIFEKQLACFREVAENISAMAVRFRKVADRNWDTLIATRTEFLRLRQANRKAIERSRELLERVRLSTEKLSDVFGRRP